MLATIILLAAFGLLMILLETFLPGWIAGSIGVLLLIAAVGLVLGAEELVGWSVNQRLIVAGGIIVGSIVSVVLWLRFFAFRIARRSFTLKSEIASPPSIAAAILGAEGVALTELRPLGRAEFSGARHEVRVLGGFVPAGTRLRVTGAEPGNLIVIALVEPNWSKKPSESPAETFSDAIT